MSRDARSDAELVQAANAGDVAAFEALYERYRDWVLRVAHRFTHNRDDAFDVLQDVFLYLLRKFPGFVLSARLTTVLYPAIKNTALYVRRRRSRGAQAPLPDIAAPPARDLATPLADDLGHITAGLPEAQREALLMRYVDDMSLAEIAAVLEIPLGTVKSRLHAAIEALRADPRTRQYFE